MICRDYRLNVKVLAVAELSKRLPAHNVRWERDAARMRLELFRNCDIPGGSHRIVGRDSCSTAIQVSTNQNCVQVKDEPVSIHLALSSNGISKINHLVELETGPSDAFSTRVACPLPARFP